MSTSFILSLYELLAVPTISTTPKNLADAFFVYGMVLEITLTLFDSQFLGVEE